MYIYIYRCMCIYSIYICKFVEGQQNMEKTHFQTHPSHHMYMICIYVGHTSHTIYIYIATEMGSSSKYKWGGYPFHTCKNCPVTDSPSLVTSSSHWTVQAHKDMILTQQLGTIHEKYGFSSTSEIFTAL